MIKINGLDEEKSCVIEYSLITILTALLFRSTVISICIGIAEVLMVMYFVIKGRRDTAFLLFVFFLSTVIENVYFATGITGGGIKLYGFENLPIVRTYHILVIALVIYIFTCLLKKTNTKFNRWNIFLTMLWLCALLVSMLVFIAEENGIQARWGLIRLVIVDAYNALFIIFVYTVTLNLLSEKVEYVEKIKNLITGILKGSVVSALVLMLLGNVWKTSEGTIYLICPLVFYWSPVLLLFHRTEKRLSYVIYAVLSIIIQIRCTLGIPGAWWITTGMILIAFAIEAIRFMIISKKITILYLFTILFLGIIFIIGFVLLSNGESLLGKGYIAYKLRTALSLLDFSSEPMVWLSRLGESVGIRVEEIVNIGIELFRNPFYFLFGKGFGGTITHAWGIFNWDQEAAFSEVQRNYQAYSVFHTGIAEMMINYGLIGFLFVLIWGHKLIKLILGKSRNPYLLVGVLYLLFFYSSFWCMVLCIVMMAYGVYIEEKRKSIF